MNCAVSTGISNAIGGGKYRAESSALEGGSEQCLDPVMLLRPYNLLYDRMSVIVFQFPMVLGPGLITTIAQDTSIRHLECLLHSLCNQLSVALRVEHGNLASRQSPCKTSRYQSLPTGSKVDSSRSLNRSQDTIIVLITSGSPSRGFSNTLKGLEWSSPSKSHACDLPIVEGNTMRLSTLAVLSSS